VQDYGGAAISVVVGAIIVIIFVAMMDRHNPGKPPTDRKKDAPRDDH
jgi:hypothetical protein